MANKQQRLPNLSKLSVAIIEHYVKPVLGEKAIQEIKSPYLEKQLQTSLTLALANAEKRFINEYDDKQIVDALISLPLSGLPSVANAVKAFHDRPADQTLQHILQTQLSENWSIFSSEQIEDAVRTYLQILRKELSSSVPTIREALSTLASIENAENTAIIAEKLDQIIELLTPKFALTRIFGNAPPRPILVIGRENDLRFLKNRLGIPANSSREIDKHPLTVIQGWPGVGKTTLVSTLINEPEIATTFPDGVLWAALGERPDLFSELMAWIRSLALEDVGRIHTLEDAIAQLTAILRHRRMLIVIDDIWKSEHIASFQVAGAQCATLLTTRFNDVAEDLASTPDDLYKLPILTDKKALELLKILTPTTVKQYPDESLKLVVDLEGLPLAIQVAGRLLRAEAKYAWGVTQLLVELREGAKLLASKAPPDRAELVHQTTPTVATLLKKSTDRLDEETRIHFAFLGAFAPKPATFDLDAMAAVWEISDPKPTVRLLVDRGLLEPMGHRFQMHALLVMHARTLLDG